MDRAESVREQFAAVVAPNDQPNDQIDLAKAALLIAATEYPDLDIDQQLGVLDSLAAGAARRLGDERDPLFSINTLSEYLFDEVGFQGNQEVYYDPRNSFLNDVLDRRLGIPITLCLICIEVGKRLGIPLVGVGMPGHFLARHRDQEDLFFDPFARGVLISEEECAERMREVLQDDVPWHSGLLKPVSDRDYIARILRNLKVIYLRREDHQRVLTVIEFLLLLLPQSIAERRDRGLTHFNLQHYDQALEDLSAFLDSAQPGPETEAIDRVIARIRGLQNG